MFREKRDPQTGWTDASSTESRPVGTISVWFEQVFLLETWSWSHVAWSCWSHPVCSKPCLCLKDQEKVFHTNTSLCSHGGLWTSCCPLPATAESLRESGSARSGI